MSDSLNNETDVQRCWEFYKQPLIFSYIITDADRYEIRAVAAYCTLLFCPRLDYLNERRLVPVCIIILEQNIRAFKRSAKPLGNLSVMPFCPTYRSHGGTYVHANSRSNQNV